MEDKKQKIEAKRRQDRILNYIRAKIQTNKGVLIIGRSSCPYTTKAKNFAETYLNPLYYSYIDLTDPDNEIYVRYNMTHDDCFSLYPTVVEFLSKKLGTGLYTVPQIFVGESYVGDSNILNPRKANSKISDKKIASQLLATKLYGTVLKERMKNAPSSITKGIDKPNLVDAILEMSKNLKLHREVTDWINSRATSLDDLTLPLKMRVTMK